MLCKLGGLAIKYFCSASRSELIVESLMVFPSYESIDFDKLQEAISTVRQEFSRDNKGIINSCQSLLTIDNVIIRLLYQL